MEDLVKELEQLQKVLVKNLAEEMQDWMQKRLSGAFTPASLLYFAESLGINLSGVPGMTAQQDSFDPYRVLGLERTDKDEAVKRRYRELLMKLHPDTAGVEGTSFLLQVVLAAYKQISKERGWR
jgi:DnaJ-domain-containing protein 1